jgi:hypothetical protein
MKKIVIKMLLLATLSIACNHNEKEKIKGKKDMASDSVLTSQNHITVPNVSESKNDQNVVLSDSVNQLIQQADTLKKYYNLLIENPTDEQFKMLFFEAFPCDFEALHAIYGNKYLEERIDGLPVENFFEHIERFYSLSQHIDQKTFYQKIINVSLGGNWEADGINVFRHNLKEKVLAKPQLTFDILQVKKDSEVISFFFFFFDGPHPPEEVPREFEEFQNSHSRIYNLLKEGMAQAKEPHLLN